MNANHKVTVAATVLTLLSATRCLAEEIPVSGQIVEGVVLDPGNAILTPGGIVVAQGYTSLETLTGDLAGTIHHTAANFLVHVDSGEGLAFGYIDWPDPLAEGGFRGPFYATISAAFGPGVGDTDATWLPQGYGVHQGARAVINITGPISLPQDYAGVIIVPAGP